MNSGEYPIDSARLARSPDRSSERVVTDGGERSDGSRSTSGRRPDGGTPTAFFERVLEGVAAGVGVYDDRGQFTYVNDAYAALLGRSIDELEAAHLWNVRPDIDADDFEGYWEGFEADETRTVETSCRRPDGTEVPVEVRTTPVVVDGTRYHVATVSDVTERVRAREKIRRQDDRVTDLASVLSHDLRNPLNVAMGRVRLTKEEVESEHIGHVEQSLERMESLIEDVLTLTRSGSRLSDSQPVSLARTVEAAWENVEADEATLEVDDDLGTVRSEEHRIVCLFENLFENAVEHGAGSSSAGVTVRVGRLPDDAGFYVADDGPGVPEAERERVFDHGYSTADGANGFGLSVVEAIAEAHDWTVSVGESESGGARVAVRNVTFES